MKTLRAMAALAALTASGAEARQPIDPFCVELRRVVAAAGDNPPFASLPRGNSPAARPMFGFDSPCGVDDRARPFFVCQEQLAPPEVTSERLIAASARCLRGAVRLADREREEWGGGTLLRLSAGDVVISAADWGHQTRGGRQSSFRVERAPRRDEP
jgi:hypothetical protein